MEEVDFTDDEIYQELEALGYRNIPSTRFQQFKDELFRLIKQERSHNSSASSQADGSYYASISSHDGRLPSSYSMHSATGDHSAVNGSTSVHAPDRRNDVIVQQQSTSVNQQENGRVPRSKSSHSVPSSSSQPLSTDRQRPSAQRVMKRKVLRKVDGQTSMCESVTESETSDGLAELQEQLRRTVLDCERPRPRSAPPVTKLTKSMDDDDDDDVSDDNRPVSARSDNLHQRRPHTACREQMYNLPENYHGPKALIRPMSCEPHVQNIKKTDPVARYQTYRQCWTSCRAPGEKAHKQLRWGVREKMLYHDQVVDKKPQRSYQPNSYVVPSDKKRKTLRWQIRMDLAQGVKPPSMFD